MLEKIENKEKENISLRDLVMRVKGNMRVFCRVKPSLSN
jgi:hypothetical protein